MRFHYRVILKYIECVSTSKLELIYHDIYEHLSRWRAVKFDEEVAPELTMVTRAKEMNERLERFREQEEVYGEFD